jgi:hypothetical protein
VVGERDRGRRAEPRRQLRLPLAGRARLGMPAEQREHVRPQRGRLERDRRKRAVIAAPRSACSERTLQVTGATAMQAALDHPL